MGDNNVVAQIQAALQKHAGDPEARALIQDLAKVLATPGAVRTDLVPTMGKPRLKMLSNGRYEIQSIGPTTWFSPNQPISPQADRPEQNVRGRRYDFQPGQNIQFQPKSEFGSGIPFATLRGLATAFDLLALVIETRKDQICAQEWEIVPKDEEADENAEVEQIKAARAFIEQPNPDMDYIEFMRALADDDLICGSMALYPRPNRGGKLHSVVPIDVATIKLLIDPYGMTPTFPDPAYQQYMKGVPAVDYYQVEATGLSTDADIAGQQLAYWRRNPRTNRLYGYSPVEQIIMTVNIALRRQESQLNYYTDGSIPDMILGVPDTWNPEQLQDVQNQWDDMLSGNLRARRKVRFAPEMKGIVLPKDGAIMLTDETDNWFARIICFAFSISPAALQKMVNRASGQQMAETAKEEGLLPLLHWYERKLTWIINVLLGLDRVKFRFKTTVEIDPAVKATTNVAYVGAGIMSRDEARKDIALEPRGMDELTVTTASGPVPVKEAVDASRKNLLNPPVPVAPGGIAGARPPAAADDNKAPAKKPPVKKVDGEDEDDAAKSIVVHNHIGSPIVDLSGLRVTTPKQGDIHINTDMRTSGPDGVERVVRKTIRGRRDPESGDLFADVVEKLERTTA